MRRGEEPTVEEYARRHPELAPEIRDLLPTMLAVDRLASEAGEPRAPGAGGRPEFPGYRVLREIGRGGMGVVYRARDLRRGVDVALKTLLWAGPSALLRFKQEFRSLADVSHPGLVSLYELVSDGERWFFTMELLEGTDFLHHVRGAGDRLRAALRRLAEGLHALHAAGLLHRDIKPSNVMVTREGRVVLLDFGLAAAVVPGGLHKSTHRHAVGTVAYMAPEQAMGDPVSTASDWYSLGVLLYEVLAGRLPYEGDGLKVLMDKQAADPPPPSSLAGGVPPDLEALCLALLRRDPGGRPKGDEVLRSLAGPEVAAAPAATPRAPALPRPLLLGRERHLEALGDCMREVRRGRTVLALVQGPSGMGKSTLVQRFLEDLAGGGGTVVLEGRCYERESVPYKAFDSPVDALARYLERLPRVEVEAILPRGIASLTRVFPGLLRVGAVALAHDPVPEVQDPVELRRRAFGALREMLARIGDRHALVLSVDDLQWGDADSAVLLEELLRPPDPPILLYLGSFRVEDAATSPFLQALRRIRESLEGTVEFRETVVEPLTERESAELASSLLGEAAGREEARGQAIARESRGNPSFVFELVQHALSGVEGGSGPLTLEEAVRNRIRGLAEAARRLLEVVSASGRPIDAKMAGRAAGLDGGTFTALGALRAGQFVRSTGASGAEAIDTFHDRVRETVLAGMAPGDLRERHAAIAAALEADARADPEVLAVHYQGAGESPRAAARYAEAGERAARALAFDHAARLCRLALDLGGQEAGERRNLLGRLGDALSQAGRGAEAADAYLEAAAGADAVEASDYARRAAEQLIVSGRLDEGLDRLRPVLASYGMVLHGTGIGTLLRALARDSWLGIRGLRFREGREEGIPPEERARLDTCETLASALSQSDMGHGFYWTLKFLSLALSAGEPSRLSRALAIAGGLHAASTWRPSRRADRELRLSRVLAEGSRNPKSLFYAGLTEAVRWFVGGRWKEALEGLERAEAMVPTIREGVQWGLNMRNLYHCMSLDFLGRISAVADRYPSLLASAEARGDLYLVTDFWTRIVYLHQVAEDRGEEALRGIDEAIGRWGHRGFDLQHARALEGALHASFYIGDAEGARRRLAEQWGTLARLQFLRLPILFNVFHALRGRASLLLAAGRPPGPGRETPLREAEADAARLDRRHQAAYGVLFSRLLRSGAAHLRGDAEGAVRLLDSCEKGFAAEGMAMYAATARRCRGVLRGGEEGRGLVASADAAMAAQGIRNPAAWARMYAPGFW